MLNAGVTGGSGFVGQELIKALQEDESVNNVKCFGRTVIKGDIQFVHFDLSTDFDIGSELKGLDVMIHCAAKVHDMSNHSRKCDDAYFDVNTESTLRLANQAAVSGVKKFIFLSSVKAVCEFTQIGQCVSSTSSSNPTDAYGRSKAAAEKGLLTISENTGMRVIIVRAPLIYGPGVSANFESLLKLARLNLPLPLGSVRNKRSIVSVRNLTSMIIACIEYNHSQSEIFMVSDGKDVSTPELLAEMTIAFGKCPRIFRFPVHILLFIAKVLGRRTVSQRLLGSLQVDITSTIDKLGWRPRVSLRSELTRCVDFFEGGS